MRVGIPACFMNIVSGAKQFGGCDQEIVGTLQPTVQEVVGAPWPVRSWDCLMLRWERFVTDPRPCGIGRRRPCEAHGRTKAYAARALPDSPEASQRRQARHIPCRVMQVAETHSSQLSNSTTPLRQWSPSLILQADPSMSPLSRPLHKLIWPRRVRALSSPWLPSRRAAPADPPRQPQLLQDASAFLCNFPGAACVGLVMQGFDKAFWVAGGDQ